MPVICAILIVYVLCAKNCAQYKVFCFIHSFPCPVFAHRSRKTTNAKYRLETVATMSVYFRVKDRSMAFPSAYRNIQVHMMNKFQAQLAEAKQENHK